MLYVKTSLLHSYQPTSDKLLSAQSITTRASPTTRPPTSFSSMLLSAGSFPNALTLLLPPPISLTKQTIVTPPLTPSQNLCILSTYDQEILSSKCKSRYNSNDINLCYRCEYNERTKKETCPNGQVPFIISESLITPRRLPARRLDDAEYQLLTELV